MNKATFSSDLLGLYTMSGESMAHKVISKASARLKLLNWRNKYLRPDLFHSLCNALIQPHFDSACSVLYPNLSKKLKNRIQTSQNKCILSKNLKSRIQTSQSKCICFCLQLDKMSHIPQKQFETINSLPIKERYNQCVNSIAFKYFDNQCPHHLNEAFMKAPENSSSLRNSYQKLRQAFHKANTGQNPLSFIGPELWNKVLKQIKRTTNLNAFKHYLKKHYLKELVTSNFYEKLSLLISLV